MSQDYIYAVTRVRARETGLLTKGDLERLMACQTEEECLRVLRDKGWGREDRSSAGEMLAAEEEKTWEFLKELTQDLSPFAPLVLPTDGNNLKAAVKCAVLEASPQGVFLPGGQWAPEALLSMARERDFSSLPPALAQAAERACRALLQTGDGQLCDVLIDRACLEELLRLGRESSLPVLKRYGELTVAGADIRMAARACRAGKNREFLQLALAPAPAWTRTPWQGRLSKAWRPCWPMWLLRRTAGEFQPCRSPWRPFEKWCDDQALELLQGEKMEYETAGPLFAYAVARRRETDTVRILLSGKRNGLPEGRIRERLRETYV